ncbi:1594_t:CDS:2 [Diversispora eburnea]|uniref:1594_t:CDS:1 n=1 Tax=Diversispora eburnea TaxID=1213867 RepID=A0A9N8YPP9_9GLOM|nr:1594_t:CDS:2 [Diversispora eburnea]
MAKDVISEIIEDHKIIKNLWQRFEGETNNRESQKIANTIIREIAIHSHCEEIHVYPLLENHLPNGKEVADHNREEHLQIKNDLAKLDGMNVVDSGYKNLFDKVMKEFEKHVEEEENDIYPKFKESISTDLLNELGENPHPSAPDKPPAETIDFTKQYNRLKQQLQLNSFESKTATNIVQKSSITLNNTKKTSKRSQFSLQQEDKMKSLNKYANRIHLGK